MTSIKSGAAVGALILTLGLSSPASSLAASPARLKRSHACSLVLAKISPAHLRRSRSGGAA